MNINLHKVTKIELFRIDHPSNGPTGSDEFSVTRVVVHTEGMREPLTITAFSDDKLVPQPLIIQEAS